MGVNRITREDLCLRWAAKGYRSGAEIGVWKGEFSQRICELVKGVSLLCVDPWQQYRFYNDDKNHQGRMDAAYAEACERLKPYDCTIWRMTSHEAAARVPDGSLDFVYIDGNHSEPYITQDLEAWAPKVRSGGMVCGHDYVRRKKRPALQVADAVDRFVAAHELTLMVFTGDKTPSFGWEVA
jgi:hypothetical protein